MRTRTIAVAALLVAITASIVAASCSPADEPPEDIEAGPAVSGWHRIAAGDLSARHSAHAFWTGTEALILGGDSAPPRCPPEADCNRDPAEFERDGAAVDLRAGTWRVLSPAPVPLGPLSGAIVDGDLYLWAQDSGAFLRYDIADDRWEALPAPPDPPSGLELVAAGTRVIAFSPTQELGLVPDRWYDPGTGAWLDLPLDPIAPAFDRSVVWTGTEAVVLGIRLDPTRPPNRPATYAAAALDAESGEWHRLPDSEIVGWNPAWFWAGGSIVNPTIGSADGGEVNNWGRHFPFGGSLTPPGIWGDLPAPPAGGAGYPGLSVAGGEFAVSTEGWVLHVPTGRWIPLPRPLAAPDHGAATAWADDRLLVWGGVTWRGGAAVVLDTGWMWIP